jgi:hypothetical protein
MVLAKRNIKTSSKLLLGLALFGLFFLGFSKHASALSVEGKWDNHGSITITKVEVTDSDVSGNILSDEAKQIAQQAGPNASSILTKLAQQGDNKGGVGAYVNGNIGAGSVYKHNTNGCDAGKQSGQIDGHDHKSDNPTITDIWINYDQNITGVAGSYGCFNLIKGQGSAISPSLKLDGTYKDVWFNLNADNKMTRVDGQAGTFTQIPGGNGRYNTDADASCGGTKSYVQLGGDKGNNLVDADYEPCDNTFHTCPPLISCDGTSGANGVTILVSKDPKLTTTPGGTPGAGSAAPTCESNNSKILVGWLICSVIDGLDSAVDSATQIVNDLLDVNPQDYSNANLERVWSVFRALASFGLLGVAMVMIIGQALGGE